MNNIEEVFNLNKGKTLAELDIQLENARQMAVQSIADGNSSDMITKYMNAWALASDMYYSRKYPETYKM